jgi:hypothetical protein
MRVSHHFTKDTTEAYEWCKPCNRLTKHRVYDGRLAHCLEHGPKANAEGLSKRQAVRKAVAEYEKNNPRLF